MSFEPVDVHIVDQLSSPIEGVLVKVYDPTGATFYTQATTNAEGVASMLLETLGYTMRLYKFQSGFAQPQHFVVNAPPAVNSFNVQGESFVLPLATDPRLCRCSGYFRDLDGSPKRYLDIHAIGQFAPILLDDAAVISEERHLRTDENGYAQVDLIRGAKYWGRVESLGSAMAAAGTSTDLRCISVPDAASASLPNLLLPIVDKIVVSPVGPYSLTVGSEVTVTPEIYDSAGALLEGTATGDVQWKSSDEAVLRVTAAQNTLVLRGNAPGTAQLLATRKDSSIIKIPNVPIMGQPLDVTVT